LSKSKALLIPVGYQEFSYTGIKPILQEVPAHFDITPEHHYSKKSMLQRKLVMIITRCILSIVRAEGKALKTIQVY
jgi:hypothetical protein